MHIFHAVFAAIFGLVFVSVIRKLSIREKLTMRYTLGWLLIGFLLLGYPLLLLGSQWLGRILDVQQLAILLGIPLIVVGAVCVQLSISVSGLTEQVRTLGEAVAHLNKMTGLPEKEKDVPELNERDN